MRVPEKIRIILAAENRPIKGLFATLKFATARKNPFNMVFGPSGDTGEIEATRDQILKEAQKSRNLFLMDYGDLETEFTGQLTVTPMNRQSVEGALKAYRLFTGNYEYPANYEEMLHRAHAILTGLAGSQLTATVSCEPDKSAVVETVPVAAA